jgi:glycosyltransferase involved in cell wall biosynthesis
VISTAVGGVVDVLGPAQRNEPEGFSCCPRGLRVASQDEAGFVAGLLRLIDDSPLRRELGECGERFIRANYSKERLLADVAALYEQLLTDSAAPVLAAPPPKVELGKQVIRCAS